MVKEHLAKRALEVMGVSLVALLAVWFIFNFVFRPRGRPVVDRVKTALNTVNLVLVVMIFALPFVPAFAIAVGFTRPCGLPVQGFINTVRFFTVGWALFGLGFVALGTSLAFTGANRHTGWGTVMIAMGMVTLLPLPFAFLL